MRFVIGFFRFWYDFIVGDSWRIALGVLLVILVTYVVVHQSPGLAGIIEPFYLLALIAVFAGVLFREAKGAAK